MKLSYRDKVIFIVAIIAVIAVAGVFLFIRPKFDEMNMAKNNLAAKQAEKAQLQERIDTLPQLVDDLKAMAQEVEDIQSYFLPDLEPYQNEEFVYEMLKECDIEVLSMSTSYTTGSEIIEYMVYDKNVHAYNLLMQGDLYDELPEKIRNYYNNVTPPDASTITIGVTNVSIEYEDTSENNDKLFKFLDKIADDERTMYIPTFSGTADEVNKDGEVEEGVQGSIELVLYSLFPLNIDRVMEESDQVEIVPSAE